MTFFVYLVFIWCVSVVGLLPTLKMPTTFVVKARTGNVLASTHLTVPKEHDCLFLTCHKMNLLSTISCIVKTNRLGNTGLFWRTNLLTNFRTIIVSHGSNSERGFLNLEAWSDKKIKCFIEKMLCELIFHGNNSHTFNWYSLIQICLKGINIYMKWRPWTFVSDEESNKMEVWSLPLAVHNKIQSPPTPPNFICFCIFITYVSHHPTNCNFRWRQRE